MLGNAEFFPCLRGISIVHTFLQNTVILAKRGKLWQITAAVSSKIVVNFKDDYY